MTTRPSGVRPKTVLSALFIAWLVLWSASVLQDLFLVLTGFDRKIWLLDVDFEGSIYTWFSTLLLAFAAVLAFVLASWRGEGDRGFARQWATIGAILLLLSMDESLSFHERLSGILGGVVTTTGIFKFAWVIPALALVAIVAILFLPFLRQLPRRVAGTMVAAGAVFVAGAVGMEMVAGQYVTGEESEEIFVSLSYRLMANIEEGLEVLGVLLVIKAFLMQARMLYPDFFRD
ncbi:hypothetical protein [Jannaschia rubra]|uniref:hypothetical protein n=1 Tax=Jannaschia rubra TaxID=282197 RepID=UPI002492478A|nr:hypothetical protein [Jannaschia rubra]